MSDTDAPSTSSKKKTNWPKWNWDSGGAYRVSPRRPCWVCGAHSNCQVSAEGVVCCRRETEKPEAAPRPYRIQSPADEARWYEWGHKHGTDGRDWVPVDPETGRRIEAPVLSEEEEAALEAEKARDREARRRAVFVEHMRLIGAGDGQTEPVEGYLKQRGIDPAWLPGGRSPHGWVYFEQCPEYWPWGDKVAALETHTPRSRAGGILAAITAPWRPGVWKEQYRGAHATFIVPDGKGGWRKRDAKTAEGRDRPQRIMHGQLGGVVTLWGGDKPERGVYPGGVLLIGEGLETTQAAQAACGGGEWTAWAALAANNLTRLELPAELVGVDEVIEEGGRGKVPRLHTVIFLGDLDKARTSAGKFNKTGQLKTAEAVLAWRERYPWLTVVGRWASSRHFPELVEAVKPESDEENARGRRAGWLDRFWAAQVSWFNELPAPLKESVSAVEDRPIDQSRGCDWDDVLAWAVKQPGVEAVKRVGLAITDGLDLEANAERARKMLADGAATMFLTVAAAGDGASEPPAGGENEAGDGGGGTDPSGGGGGGGEAAGGGGGRGDGAGGGAKSAGGDDEHDVVVSTELGAARQYLMERQAPGDRAEQRAGGVWRLTKVDGEVQRWDGTVWVPIRSKSETGPIRGDVRQWLTPKKVWKENAEGERRKVNAASSLKTVDAIAKAVLDEVTIDADEPRFWMRPTFDDRGEPIYGRKPWQQWVRRPEKEQLPSPRDLVALEDCVLDTRAWEAGELVTRASTPMLFNQHVLPFGLPVAKVRAALKGGHAGMQALAAKSCPELLRLLGDIFLAAEDPKGAAEQIEQLQMLLWYYTTYAIDCKEANIAAWVGPDNAGKGTLMDLYKGVVGRGNYVASTIDELSDKNHITSWMGKRLAVISEAEAGDRADLKRGMNFAKRISGGDEVALRELYKLEKPAEQLPTRILISCNQLPEMKDKSGALLSRVIAFEFKVSHTGRSTYDPGRKARVFAEIPGAFLWAMAGGLKVGERRRAGGRVFTQPSQSASVLEMWRSYVTELPDFVGTKVTEKDGRVEWTGWLEITNDKEHVLPLMDMWAAFMLYRSINGNPKPDAGGPAQLSKDILTLLRRAGLKLNPEANKRMIDAASGQRRQGAAYLGLRLSKMAKEEMASRHAAEMKRHQYGPSEPMFPGDLPV